MKDLIVTIALLLFVFAMDALSKFVSGKLKKSKVEAPDSVPEAENEEHYEEIPTVQEEPVLEKKPPFSPKVQEYFTYETLDSTSEDLTVKPQKATIKEPQMVDISEDNPFALTFSDEEIYKGFIYSEILDRKYK